MNTLFENVGKTRGIAIMILDIFLGMIDDKGIMIPDDDREGDEDESCLYGSTYYELEDEITELLCDYIDE